MDALGAQSVPYRHLSVSVTPSELDLVSRASFLFSGMPQDMSLSIYRHIRDLSAPTTAEVLDTPASTSTTTPIAKDLHE